MNIHKLSQEFLHAHTKADHITMDANTGLPVQAEYTTLKGRPRRNKAIYRFDPTPCYTHRSYNQCELIDGHPGPHKSGGLTWD